MKKTRPSHVSKTPPPGWPTEAEWKEIEKKLGKGLASKMLPQDAGPVERTKHEICSHFVRYFRGAKITQKEMAKLLDVTESRISEILHYHHERFTIDKLLDLLARIKPDVRLKVA
jgi:predicted XRE-type DNA-binding protein